MTILDSTKAYESWLAKQTILLKADLVRKHQAMREDAFTFLRATYYRWAQISPKVCHPLAGGPAVLAVGDLHLENFGTWRDAESRLVWGINDFDECHPLPFTHDLVRLATSACLAISEGRLDLSFEAASAAILRGYLASLKAGGNPFVLADRSTPLREMARHRLEAPERFWKKFQDLPALRQPVPKAALGALRECLPPGCQNLRFAHRVAGKGSLGRQRFTALATWRGGLIVREAKALSPSACVWAQGGTGRTILYADLLRRAVRAPDPLVRVRGHWLIRRLSPDCFRIELTDLPGKRDEVELLHSMGCETANIHLGSRPAAELRKALQQKPRNWLQKAAALMRDETVKDWKAWRKNR